MKCQQVKSSNPELALICGHSYCQICWSVELREWLQHEGSNAIHSKCIFEECQIPVSMSIWNVSLEGSRYINTYYEFLKDYFEDNKIYICQIEGCKNILTNYDPEFKITTCDQCKHELCSKCLWSYHSPCDCSMVNEWESLPKMKCKFCN